MRLVLAACLVLFNSTAFAEDAVREVKTANPFILLHPESQQAAAAAYYEAVEKNVFNGAIPLKHAQLAGYLSIGRDEVCLLHSGTCGFCPSGGCN
jgi:hypothetical protein